MFPANTLPLEHALTLAGVPEDTSDTITAPNENNIEEILTTLFTESTNARTFFDTLKDESVLEHYFPLINELTTIPAGPEEHHKEGTAYEHTMRVLDESQKEGGTHIDLYAALAHDFGKLATDEEELPSHPKHAVKAKEPLNEFINRHELTEPLPEAMHFAARYHMYFHKISDLRGKTLLDFANALDESPFSAENCVRLALADSNGRVPRAESDSEAIREHITFAKDSRNEVTTETIEKNYDVNSPEHKDDLLLQDRIRYLKDKRP